MERKSNNNWEEIVIDYLNSGLTRKEYAKQKNLKDYSLSYHVRRYNNSFKGFIEVTNSSIELDTKNNTSHKPYIEISFNKVKIAIYNSYDEELLLSVLRTVKKI